MLIQFTCWMQWGLRMSGVISAEGQNRICAGVLGAVVALLAWGHFWPHDDMTVVLCPAALAQRPYTAGFLYPIWTLYLLRAFCCMPRWSATLAAVWSVLVVLVCSGTWRTLTWVPLLAPPFLLGLVWGHPFEAVVFLGLTLIARGHAGWGLALLAFKPQLGLVPGLYVAWAHRREWKTFVPLAVLVIVTTSLDLALGEGRFWVVPFYRATSMVVNASWNMSLWQAFRWMSLLWLPIGGWALSSQGDVRRRLAMAYAIGLLLVPYWAAYSLWPLVAMAGCWIEEMRH